MRFIEIAKYFQPEEFIPPRLHEWLCQRYGKYTERYDNAFFKYVNIDIVRHARTVRSHFKRPVLINNWHSGKSSNPYTLRGWRPYDWRSNYSQVDLKELQGNEGFLISYADWHDQALKIAGRAHEFNYSQHERGIAIDYDVYGVPAEEVRREIKIKGKGLFPLLTRVEDKVSWNHNDLSHRCDDKIYFFNP